MESCSPRGIRAFPSDQTKAKKSATQCAISSTPRYFANTIFGGSWEATLAEEDAYAIGRAFGTVVRRAGGGAVAVGYDGRESSPRLEEELNRGLTESGVDVVRVGLGPTPMLYFAEAELAVDGVIQITGSQNPADYNVSRWCCSTDHFLAIRSNNSGR